MMDSETSPIEGIAHNGDSVGPVDIRLGENADGTSHVYLTTDGTSHVIRDNEHVQRFNTGTRSIADYVNDDGDPFSTPAGHLADATRVAA
ncbi:hypothetical protein [Natrinema pallidum]|nr:hypothetical protein [Natrinema pallidum]